jgi:hypothetical protein
VKSWKPHTVPNLQGVSIRRPFFLRMPNPSNPTYWWLTKTCKTRNSYVQLHRKISKTLVERFVGGGGCFDYRQPISNVLLILAAEQGLFQVCSSRFDAMSSPNIDLYRSQLVHLLSLHPWWLGKSLAGAQGETVRERDADDENMHVFACDWRKNVSWRLNRHTNIN